LKNFWKNTARLFCLFAALSAAAFAGVTVSSPTSGSTVGSPVHFVASATSANPITGMRIYIDSVDVYHVSAGKIDTSLAVAAGKHTAVIKAWDSTGASTSASVSFSVSTVTSSPTPTPTPNPSPSPSPSPTPTPTPSASPTPSPSPTPTPSPSVSPSPTPDSGLPTPPSNAIVQSDIDQMAGWQSCSACAGAAGSGPVANYLMTENVLSPSLDSKSAQFDISGTTPYSDVLWWKQLGANASITNFKYDVYFYLTSPQLAQALEFDVNQSDKVHKFIFGTQCNLHDGAGGHWDVWGNAAGNWQSTGIACSQPAAFTWHHLTWEFQRTSTNVIFVGFTLDGVTHYVNKSYPAKASTSSEINVAFQMDGDSHMDAYSTWLDKISLAYW
jgi:hypothetical protein